MCRTQHISGSIVSSGTKKISSVPTSSRSGRTGKSMAAVSTLPPVAASNVLLLSLPKLNPPVPTTFFRTHSSVSSFTAICSLNGDSKEGSALELTSGTRRRRLLEVGIGLLALPLVPLDAGATRVEYYATVGEPLCDLSFVKSGLGYCDVAVGNGVQPPQGELINVHYTARFGDGTVFDSSYKRGRPLTMRIGVGKVIPGLDQGILGGDGIPPMLVGGKRKLLIPPELAYGPEPAGCFSGDCNIPANATLLYDILFVGVYK